MEIQTYIADLLSEHDCVIIPGMGGFVGSYMPAQIHPVYHTFQPPSKKILFNINLRQNDGLLANSIAQGEKITFAQANEHIRQFAEETIKSLKTRKYLILQGIGKLYMGKEGNIQFDQDLRSNLLPESFGLHPFFSAPVKRDPHKDRLEKREQMRTETRELVRRAIPKPLKWAAILAVPIAVAIMLTLAGYDSIKSGSWSTADIFSSLSPFSKADTKQAPPEEVSPARQYERDGTEQLSTAKETNFGPVREKAEQVSPVEFNSDPGTRQTPVRSTVPAETSLPPQTSQSVKGSFAVIIGAFGVESNAHNLAARLNQKGIQARIFDRSSGGLTRVTAGVFSTEEEANRMMNTMKANGFPGAWILEK